jgi:hypothetical protein
LTFQAEKVVPLLLFGFKNTISLAISWRRVAAATHLTYLSGVWSKQCKVGVQFGNSALRLLSHWLLVKIGSHIAINAKLLLIKEVCFFSVI